MHGRRVRRIPDGSYWNGPDGQARAQHEGESPPYRLSAHVFLCRSGRHTVFLDVRADRYFAVDTEAAEPILRRVEGWIPRAPPPSETAGAVDAARKRRLEKLARSLFDAGLLARDFATGKPVMPVPIEAPRDDLTGVGLADAAVLGASDVARFVLATLTAWVIFRLLPLERLVRRVSSRRRRRSGRAAPFDPRLARHCVAAYERLRPLAFTARDACLFESFVFLELAARYGLYPAWVFGVQTTPFAAHCWVQQGSIALNDAAEHAGSYTPIMLA